MPTIPPMPQSMTAVLPFLALIVTSWLQHSTAPKWLNVLIALLFPLGLATIWALLGDALTPNLGTDITILVTLCYALMALSDMAGLRAWLQDTLVSPAALFASHHRIVEADPAIIASPPPMTPYPTPTGLDLRRSALPPSRRPQFVDPSPTLHARPIPTIDIDRSKPIVVISVPSQSTEPMETPPQVESSTPDEEPPATPTPV